MKLQVCTLDVSPLLEDTLFMKYKNCIAKDRAKKAEQYKAKADQARCIGAGILLAMAYEQFQKENGESAGAGSLFACCVTAYELTADGIKNTEKKELKTCDIVTENELCKLTKALPIEQIGEKGKPFFAEGPFFNISHAGDMVVVAMASENVGVDIERKRSCKESVMNRCFTEDEIDKVKEAKEQKDKAFTEIWTKKEAVAKMTGMGLADIWDKKKPEGVAVHSIWLNESYVISICMADLSFVI